MYFQMKNILKNNHNHTPKHIYLFFGFWLISPLKSCNSKIFLINFLKSKTTRNISFLYFFFLTFSSFTHCLGNQTIDLDILLLLFLHKNIKIGTINNNPIVDPITIPAIISSV